MQQVPEFLTVLWKRHVVQFGAIYLATAWVLLQVVLAVTQTLHLPDWVNQVALIFLALGFPPLMILAWTREPAAARPAESAALGKPAAARPSQTIRYCTASDGVRIAYASTGAGPPIVKTANWMTHLEYDWEYSEFRQWYSALAEDHQLIRYDERGCGLSDWEVDDISFDAFVRDLETVVDATGVEKFVLFGISQGSAVALAYAVRHPERVAGIIILGGFPCGQRASGNTKLIETAQTLEAMMRLGWGSNEPTFRQVFTSMMFPDADKDTTSRFNEMQRHSASPENAVRIFEAISHMDVRELLSAVRAPTLILHASGDRMVRCQYGHELAKAIPGAHMVTLDSDNHTLVLGDPAWPKADAELRAFLDEHWPGESAAR